MNLSPAAILQTAAGKLLGQSLARVVGALPLIVSPDDYFLSLFGEQRVVAPYTLFDLVNKYELDTTELETSTATGGSATWQSTTSSIRLAVTGGNGSTAKMRTISYFRYQAGKTLVTRQSVFQSALVANQTRRWGLFDDNDGLFFQTTNTTIQIAVRSSSGVGTQVVDKANWNVDKLDGAGPSGVTLNILTGSIFEIHLQWLGVGTVKFYVNGFLVHEILHANTLIGPYMKTAQLPLSWEVVNTAASTASTFDAICASVQVLGGDDPPGQVFAAFNATDISVTTTERPILSIRPKATYGGGAIDNRAMILPVRASIRTEGSRLGYRLILNATLTGASFASVDATSKTERDVSATAFAGGITLYQGFLPGTNDRETLSLRKMFNILDRKLRRSAYNPATVTDTLTLTAINENAGSTLVRGSIGFREVGLWTVT